MLWPAPRDDLKFVAAVGALESDAFKKQSRDVSSAWNTAGVDVEYLEVPDCNHFSIVNEISTPGSMLYERLVSMIEEHTAN